MCQDAKVAVPIDMIDEKAVSVAENEGAGRQNILLVSRTSRRL
jgi:hypothetical protein